MATRKYGNVYFIFRNTLWPSGRFLRGIFFKNYLGWRGPKISLKISSGAQSESLGSSLRAVLMGTKSCTKILILPKIFPTRFRFTFYG